jgi:hypothetical protein
MSLIAIAIVFLTSLVIFLYFIVYAFARDRFSSTPPSPSPSPEEIQIVIDSLPTLPLSSITTHDSSSSSATGSECSICLVEFSETDFLLRCLPCLHVFHADCIDTWFHQSLTCPICRFELLPSSDSNLVGEVPVSAV